jgi:aminopeptidase N
VNEDYATNRPNIALTMGTWETQSGFPYVTVSRSGNQLTFEQNRFLYTNRNSPSLWWVPIKYAVGSNPDFSNTKADMWLQGVKITTIDNATAPKAFTADDWIVVNIQQSGYSRVNYDNMLWNKIIQQLSRGNNEFQKIHLFNRAQLIDDSFHFARAELLNYDIVLGLMNYLDQETDYIPWVSTSRANTLLNRWISGSNLYPRYQAFVRKNVEPLYLRLGANIIANEPRVDRYARALAMNTACQAAHPVCLSQATEGLENMLSTGNAVAPDLVTPIYCNGIRAASAATFTAFQNKMLSSTSQAERNAIISGLGCTHNTALLSSLFSFAVDTSSALSSTERSRILTSAINIGESSIRTMIEFLRTNYQAVNAFGLVPTMSANIAPRVSNIALRTEFLSLLELLQSISMLSQTQVTSYIASADTIVNWQSANLEHIGYFFDVLDGIATTVEPTTTGPSTTGPTTTVPTTTAPTTIPTTTQTGETTTLGAGNIVLSAVVLTFSVVIKFLM